MGVPPFGYPWISAYVQLPAAFRSLSRPSSAYSAWASALRPFSLDLCLLILLALLTPFGLIRPGHLCPFDSFESALFPSCSLSFDSAQMSSYLLLALLYMRFSRCVTGSGLRFGRLRTISHELYPGLRACTRSGGRMPGGCTHRSALRAPRFYRDQLSLFLSSYSGGHLLSHTVSSAVPSASRGLTVVFGMGTGVPPGRIAARSLSSLLRTQQ